MKSEQDEGNGAPIHMNDIDLHSNHDLQDNVDHHDESHDDDVASISHNQDHIAKSVNKYLSSASPKRTSNYRIKSEEDTNMMRRSVDIFERASKSSSEKVKSEARYSCVTENNNQSYSSKSHKRT